MLVMTTIFISKMEGLPPTSDIKMIDVWLVLCQMVPFAEVVLLTAMEYHRKDDEHNKEGDMFAQMCMPDQSGDDLNETRCHRFWIWLPALRTLGKSFFKMIEIFSIQTGPLYHHILLLEKKVLPSLVLTGFIVYFALALVFYFDF